MELSIATVNTYGELLILANAGVGNVITNVTIWTLDTYKDLALIGNLNSHLNNTELEEFTITPLELGLTDFKGIFFIEIENDNDESLINDVVETIDIKKCRFNKTLEYIYTGKCNNDIKEEILIINMLLKGLEDSSFLNTHDKSIMIYKTLIKLCGNKCKGCPEINHI